MTKRQGTNAAVSFSGTRCVVLLLFYFGVFPSPVSFLSFIQRTDAGERRSKDVQRYARAKEERRTANSPLRRTICSEQVTVAFYLSQTERADFDHGRQRTAAGLRRPVHCLRLPSVASGPVLGRRTRCQRGHSGQAVRVHPPDAHRGPSRRRRRVRPHSGGSSEAWGRRQLDRGDWFDAAGLCRRQGQIKVPAMADSAGR